MPGKIPSETKMTSLDKLTAERNRQNASSEVVFLFVDHSPENMERVARAIIDARPDIVAIEKIRPNTFGQGTREEKEFAGALMTQLTHSGDNKSGDALESSGMLEDDFLQALVDGLRGENVEFKFIDMPTDDPNFELYTTYHEDQELNEAIEQMGDDVEQELRTAVHDNMVESAASYHFYRNELMKRQIEEIVKNNPGKRVVVMSGALHSFMSNSGIRGAKVSRSFIAGDGEPLNPAGEKMHFGEFHQTVRRRMHEMGRAAIRKV